MLHAIQPEDKANTVALLIQQPKHVNVNRIEIMPVSANLVPNHFIGIRREATNSTKDWLFLSFLWYIRRQSKGEEDDSSVNYWF